MIIRIISIIEHAASADKEIEWLKCATSHKRIVVFWGELGRSNRNIKSVKNQTLPVSIEFCSPEDCQPTDLEKLTYNAYLSVPVNAFIIIDPTR